MKYGLNLSEYCDKLDKVFYEIRLSKTDGRCLRFCESIIAGRGKSGLHRAGCRITSGGGDSKASATEINRPWRSWRQVEICIANFQSMHLAYFW